MNVQLKQLLQGLLEKKIIGNADIAIENIQTDSRKIKQGDLFIALTGHTVDGHNYIEQAIANGAVAVVLEKEMMIPESITTVFVKDSRRAMAFIASSFFQHPTEKLTVVGITGTNGKTTTSNLVERIYQEAGYQTGLIGTIHNKIGDLVEETANTTPDSLDLQRLFHRMVESGVTHAVMEVSSHALVEGRVRGVDFDRGVFTNLTQDHLDYHGTLDHYKQAKGLLFSCLGNQTKGTKCSILNSDDPASADYSVISTAEVITYGIDHEADYRALHYTLSPKGTSIELSTPVGLFHLETKLIGKFNVYNLLCAIATCASQGIPMATIIAALEKVEGIDGRFESIYFGQDFTTIVDFAHTPDSLENVLTTILEFKKGHVYCVVGCGGNRDKTKRPLMAAIAEKYADTVILTSDNPRFEEPESIIHDMEQGLTTDRYHKITDRTEAIAYAISLAKKDDVVLIAGKGHETYQIIGDVKHHFSDQEIAASYILEKQKK